MERASNSNSLRLLFLVQEGYSGGYRSSNRCKSRLNMSYGWREPVSTEV